MKVSAERQRLLERSHSIVAAEMPQERQDKFRGNAECPAAFVEGTVNPFDYCRHRNISLGMSLRIEKDFGVANVLFVRLFQIGRRQFVEIAISEQNAGALIVDVEKGLKV